MKSYDKEYKKYLEQFLENVRELTYSQLKEENHEYDECLDKINELAKKCRGELEKLSEPKKRIFEEYRDIDLKIRLIEGDRLYLNGFIDGVKMARKN